MSISCAAQLPLIVCQFLAGDDIKQADGTSALSISDCPNGLVLTWPSSEYVTIFVGKECCVRFFNPLKQLISLLPTM